MDTKAQFYIEALDNKTNFHKRDFRSTAQTV
jgi:hypothetical protein